MGLLDLLLVAVGLSMDAFAVSVCSMNYVFIIGIIQLVFCYVNVRVGDLGLRTVLPVIVMGCCVMKYIKDNSK